MKITISLFIIFCFGNASIAQHQLTEVDKLATTAKIWGFLKYYHPQVAIGKYNWDDELFRILPEVKNSLNKEQLSQIYIAWIDKLGRIEKCKKCSNNSTPDYFNENFDLSWINNNELFTKELSEMLNSIELNRHQGDKYYVTVVNKNVGNIEITNESGYKNYDWKNENLRMLALFRYWNIIEYFFPYKYQTDTNWEDVLKKMIPKFLNPEDETAFHLAMLELVVSIDDSHGIFATDKTNMFFGNYWIPAKFELIDEKAVLTGYYNEELASQDDLKIGDVITKVENREVGTIFKQQEKYINGSNISRKRVNAYYSIFNGTSDSVQIEYTRNTKTYSKIIKRYRFSDFNYIHNQTNESYKILDGNIGLVNMGTLKIKDVPDMMEKLSNTKAIIFDIRNYPQGTLYAIANYISSTKNDFYKVIYPDLNYPGKFIWRNGRQCGKKGTLNYNGKVVLLVNEKAQSHAEFTIMCLQTGDHVTTIGSQTSGADGNVSVFEMVGGYRTMISGIGIFYPDKTQTQRIGVKLDIVTKPTLQGIIDQRDEVLEKAIAYVNN